MFLPCTHPLAPTDRPLSTNAATIAMPCELTRVLTMMRDLDRKSVEMQQNVESMVGTIVQLQAQTATGATKGSAKGDLASTVEALQTTLHENQSLLIQWAEEKVQLALLGYEILRTHQTNLDQDVHHLTQFLSDTGQLEEYMPDEYNGVHADAHMYESSDPPASLARSGRRGGSTSRGAGYTTSADVYEEEPVASKQQQQSQKISLRTNIPLTLNRQPSAQPVYDDGDGGKNTTTKRRRAAAIANTAAPAQETSRSGRRTAAGQATAAVMAAQYDEEEYAAADQKAATAAAAAAAAAKQQQQAAAAAAAAAAAQQQAAALAQDPALLAQPIPLEPFIPGLAESAKEPQAARRRLEEKDIGMGLVGKVAEVYWEDEANSAASMWYLVKVESVDLANKTACVRYQNGEVETNLSLLEAARDGIMLLV